MRNRQKSGRTKIRPLILVVRLRPEGGTTGAAGAARGRLPQAARRARRAGASESTLATKHDQNSAKYDTILRPQIGSSYDHNLVGNILLTPFAFLNQVPVCEIHKRFCWESFIFVWPLSQWMTPFAFPQQFLIATQKSASFNF